MVRNKYTETRKGRRAGLVSDTRYSNWNLQTYATSPYSVSVVRYGRGYAFELRKKIKLTLE